LGRIVLRMRAFWGLPVPKTRLLTNAVLVAGSILVALLVAEALARWVFPPPQIAKVLSSGPETRTAIEAPDPQNRVLHGEPLGVVLETPTGRRLRANMSVLIEHHRLSGRDIPLRTNELGFRGPPLGAKHATRLLFVGDSITFAEYLPEEETYVELVRAAAAREGRALEVVNAGVGSAGLGDELALLTETGILADPDVVVLGFYLNDFVESPGVVIRQPPNALRWSRLAQRMAWAASRLDEPDHRTQDARFDDARRVERWRTELYSKLQKAEGDYRTDPGAFNRLVLQAFSDWGSAWSDSVWNEVLEPLLLQFKQVTDAHHLKLFVLCFPVVQQVEAEHVADYPQRKLADLVRRMGVPMLDLLPVLRRAARSAPEPLFYDHCHHTPRGSAVVAGAIWPFLRANGI
jgi:hypothetical protein